MATSAIILSREWTKRHWSDCTDANSGLCLCCWQAIKSGVSCQGGDHITTEDGIKAGLQIRVRIWKLFFLFLNQNIRCGYSKEPSQWDGSFEHPKHMFKLMIKKIIAILRSNILFIWTYIKGMFNLLFISFFLEKINCMSAPCISGFPGPIPRQLSGWGNWRDYNCITITNRERLEILCCKLLWPLFMS